jgi:hypothetical protein
MSMAAEEVANTIADSFIQDAEIAGCRQAVIGSEVFYRLPTDLIVMARIDAAAASFNDPIEAIEEVPLEEVFPHLPVDTWGEECLITKEGLKAVLEADCEHTYYDELEGER